MKYELLTDVILDDELILSLDELCQSCDVETKVIVEFVEYGVVEPKGHLPKEWHFSSYDLNRIRCARRLQDDLHVNLEALGLVLDLIEELHELRDKMKRLG